MAADVLEGVGAAHIRFNSFTAPATSRELQRIAKLSGLQLTPASAAELAEFASGDLRNAIQSLQVHLLGAQVRDKYDSY